MHILKFITQMAEEEGLSREFILGVVEEILHAVARVDFGEEAKVEVVVSDSSGDIKAFLIKKVVKEVNNIGGEISFQEAQKLNKDCKIGDEIQTPFPLQELSRNAIVVAKNILLQKIRDKKREQVQQAYMKKIGEVETGTVQKVGEHEVVVRLQEAEGFLPSREQIPGEKYYEGNTIKAYILNVTPGGKVLLSRSHPNFLKKLFTQEVPEIQENIVEIKLVARIPGIRAKIAVSSSNPRVDPVGACVGVKGSRIQAVVKEINNERIDVIQYTTEPMVLISRALSGVKILHRDFTASKERVRIVVKDEELPKAIGKNGLNATLASKLTGMKIDIISESEYKDKGIVFIQRLSKSVKELLIANGFFTITDILNKGEKELTKIDGIGEKKAKKIFELAQKLMK